MTLRQLSSAAPTRSPFKVIVPAADNLRLDHERSACRNPPAAADGQAVVPATLVAPVIVSVGHDGVARVAGHDRRIHSSV